MSEQTPTPDDSSDKQRKWTIPGHIVGKVRSSTVGLVVAFIVVLGLYLYLRPDPTTVENSPVYIPPATPSEVVVTPEYTPTRVPTTTSTPSTPSTTAPSATPSAEVEPSATTTPTTTPGFQLPTIPGLQLPGQAPTTTPAR